MSKKSGRRAKNALARSPQPKARSLSDWLKGSMVALVTPFRNSSVDVETLSKLVEFHVREGSSALVPCGTTGESATLSHQEHELVIETVIRTARGRLPVIAGTGSNSTEETLRLTRHAKRSGADAALVIAPYYNKPTQEGLYRHFKKIAESVDLPLVLYNIASRTGVNIEPSTFARLAQIRNIAGVKEASGSLEQMARIKAVTGKEFALISGDDSLTLPILSIGGVGVISVVANLVPRRSAELIEAFERGDLKEAQRIHYELLPLVKAMFIETNPIPVKTAMNLMKLIPDPGLRLPMCPLGQENLKELKAVLRACRLIR